MSALSHNCSTTVWASNATTIAGSPTGIPGFNSTLLYYPQAMMVGTNDSIYIMDCYTYCRMQLFYPGSQLGTTIINGTIGTGLNQFSSSVTSLSIDVSGNIYILDSGNPRVTKWAPGASMGIVVAGLFVDTSDSNTLYVADTSNHRIQKWLYGASNGTTVAGISGLSGPDLNRLFYPMSVTIDKNKSLYIVDYQNNRIVLWLLGATTGIVIASLPAGGVLPSQLTGPWKIRLDSTGAFIVNDRDKYSI
ncbi:unnamed protein product [Adineta steineri]|uniref:NHL repeat containing protein-like protein n=1 Tax=Adineta steineri TaxID=433720 RepID=A0A813NIK6_9BILA|nr:unnamed protein product [Adineta steineri]